MTDELNAAARLSHNRWLESDTDNTKDQIIAAQDKQLTLMREMVNMLAVITNEILGAMPDDLRALPEHRRASAIATNVINMTGGVPNVTQTETDNDSPS